MAYYTDKKAKDIFLYATIKCPLIFIISLILGNLLAGAAGAFDENTNTTIATDMVEMREQINAVKEPQPLIEGFIGKIFLDGFKKDPVATLAWTFIFSIIAASIIPRRTLDKLSIYK